MMEVVGALLVARARASRIVGQPDVSVGRPLILWLRHVVRRPASGGTDCGVP